MSGSQAESTPPQSLEDRIRLNMLRGVGPVLQRRLLERFGSVEAIFRADVAELCGVRGIGPRLADTIVRSRREIDLEAELELVRRLGVEVIPLESDRYPPNLKTIENPPLILYVRGRLLPEDALSVAVVGTRRPSIYGLNTAGRLALQLAQMGVTVVSGLAIGIDTAAHRGALKGLGRTIAVLGSGLAHIYPSENADLAEEIAQNGALISEFPMLFPVEAANFPRRNRLISGLALGVVVVEAGRRSGALITARWAAEQGREVMAVPGRIDSPSSQGTNRLIRDGATLVTSAQDIVEAIGPLHQPVRTASGKVHQARELLLNDIERRILDHLSIDEPRTIDDLVAATGLQVSTITSTLLVLQTRGLVRQLPGSRFVRREDLFAAPARGTSSTPHWRCSICRAVLQANRPPEECPFCGSAGHAFTTGEGDGRD